jgi:hypothetical protein
MLGGDSLGGPIGVFSSFRAMGGSCGTPRDRTGLNIQLRMMGIPLDGNTSVFCDNEGAVKNTTEPESPLKKKHVAIGYYRCHEALEAGFIQLAKEDTKTNLSDAFTKPLPGPRWKELLGWVLN